MLGWSILVGQSLAYRGLIWAPPCCGRPCKTAPLWVGRRQPLDLRPLCLLSQLSCLLQRLDSPTGVLASEPMEPRYSDNVRWEGAAGLGLKGSLRVHCLPPTPLLPQFLKVVLIHNSLGQVYLLWEKSLTITSIIFPFV